MSEAIAELKKREIEELEKSEKEDMDAQEKDRCPNCGQKTATFKFINAALLPYGLLECNCCGVVFCPESMRIEKMKMVEEGRGRGIVPANKL